MKKYDYIIIGAGAAGMQLAIKMMQDAFFREKDILVLDELHKEGNDHTWSFWEKGETHWDDIVTKSWKTGRFISGSADIPLSLDPYRYKTIRSADFYRYGNDLIHKSCNVTFIKDRVHKIIRNEVLGSKQTYITDHIFDSRVDPDFYSQASTYNTLKQHFKGWIVNFETSRFNSDEFIMMDYRINWNQDCSFTYVLPFDEKRALVEFTLFNETLLDDVTYDQYLKAYLDTYLPGNYHVEEVEKGIIPMSDYPFQKHHTTHVTKIGTAGGWVRPSTGYSFKNADRYSTGIIKNIKRGRIPSKGIATSRFRFYDRIFLYVLKKYNHTGEALFRKMYTQHDIRKVFRFLDEASGIPEDISIIFSYNNSRFIESLMQSLKKRSG